MLATEKHNANEDFTLAVLFAMNADSSKGSTKHKEVGQYDTTVDSMSTGCRSRCNQALPFEQRPANSANMVTAAWLT
jgi:hypothetical protein